MKRRVTHARCPANGTVLFFVERTRKGAERRKNRKKYELRVSYFPVVFVRRPNKFYRIVLLNCICAGQKRYIIFLLQFAAVSVFIRALIMKGEKFIHCSLSPSLSSSSRRYQNKLYHLYLNKYTIKQSFLYNDFSVRIAMRSTYVLWFTIVIQDTLPRHT